MEKTRRLAVFGFGTAKQHEYEAKEAALRLPYSLKHLEPPKSSKKKYTFDQQFAEQYYEESFKQKVASEASRSNNNRSTFSRGGRGNGSYGYRGGRLFLSQEGEVVELGHRNEVANQTTSNQQHQQPIEKGLQHPSLPAPIQHHQTSTNQ